MQSRVVSLAFFLWIASCECNAKGWMCQNPYVNGRLCCDTVGPFPIPKSLTCPKNTNGCTSGKTCKLTGLYIPPTADLWVDGSYVAGFLEGATKATGKFVSQEQEFIAVETGTYTRLETLDNVTKYVQYYPARIKDMGSAGLAVSYRTGLDYVLSDCPGDFFWYFWYLNSFFMGLSTSNDSDSFSISGIRLSAIPRSYLQRCVKNDTYLSYIDYFIYNWSANASLQDGLVPMIPVIRAGSLKFYKVQLGSPFNYVLPVYDFGLSYTMLNTTCPVPGTISAIISFYLNISGTSNDGFESPQCTNWDWIWGKQCTDGMCQPPKPKTRAINSAVIIVCSFIPGCIKVLMLLFRPVGKLKIYCSFDCGNGDYFYWFYPGVLMSERCTLVWMVTQLLAGLFLLIYNIFESVSCLPLSVFDLPLNAPGSVIMSYFSLYVIFPISALLALKSFLRPGTGDQRSVSHMNLFHAISSFSFLLPKIVFMLAPNTGDEWPAVFSDIPILIFCSWTGFPVLGLNLILLIPACCKLCCFCWQDPIILAYTCRRPILALVQTFIPVFKRNECGQSARRLIILNPQINPQLLQFYLELFSVFDQEVDLGYSGNSELQLSPRVPRPSLPSTTAVVYRDENDGPEVLADQKQSVGESIAVPTVGT